MRSLFIIVNFIAKTGITVERCYRQDTRLKDDYFISNVSILKCLYFMVRVINF